MPSIGEADEGQYSCIAQNEGGFKEESARIVIQDNEIDEKPTRGDIAGKSKVKIIKIIKINLLYEIQ